VAGAAGLCVWLTACSDKSTQAPSAASATATTQVAPAFGDQPAAMPPDQPGVSEQTPGHMNLQNLVHLADIDHGGLFIDFGTPARMKYTVGHWKTGWGKDDVEGDTTFTIANSNSGRVYLPLSGPEPLTLRFRLRPLGTSTVQPFLNNTALPIVRLDKGPGFAEYDVAVPADVAHAGENNLLLRFGGTKKVGDEEVAVAIDSLRVVAASHAPAAVVPDASDEAMPFYSGLLQDLAVEGQKRKAITVSAPTTLSYYIEVPKNAKLSMRVGSPDAKADKVRALVRVTSETGKSTLLWRGQLSAGWQDQVLSLEPWAASVVKLELIAEGKGIVGFSSPSILVKEAPLAQAKSQAKSVIVLLIDTMRADHLHAYNKNTRVRTPNMDSFAAEGAVFDAAQAPENWTKPSVASVLTGLYPASHGTKGSESRLSDKALMVSEAFKQAGFTTATFLANGYVSDKFGFNQGWDHYRNYIRENKSTTAESVFRDAGNWIEAHKDQRFFVYVQTIDPHVPYDPPAEFLNMYQTEPYTGSIRPRLTADMLEKAKTVPPKLTFNDRDRQYLEDLYDGEVSYHDKFFGVFIERLKKLGLYDQVMFVVTADHGEEFYDHGSYGHGHTVYQELLHVPFIARFAGTVPARHIQETVSTVDVTPTALAAAGVPVPDVMEGRDRMPHMLGALPPGPAAAFSDFLDDRRAIRAGRWKLILRGLNATLFDLKNDPHELEELDQKAHPIAMRYCRILLGQFLGARDRGDWLSANPKRSSVDLKSEAADMDDATKAGLKALGYAN
jgi:choline-sulfatase